MSHNLPEFPNIVAICAELLHGTVIGNILHTYEFAIFSIFVGCLLVFFGYCASRRMTLVPSGLQNFVELIVETLDDFIGDILGKSNGRKYLPFLGTIFVYILCMNLLGLIPFMKSSSASWSTTLAIALCVFVYVQYTAFKELGVKGYADHLMGNPRGAIALSVVMPLLMLVLHTLSELIRPISLSLRLRSNIWGEDLMLAMFAGFGPLGVPLVFVNMFMALLSAFVQAGVFFILSTVYFKLVMHDEENEPVKNGNN